MKLITSAILALACSVAFSQDKPRHIDFTQVLLGMDGRPIMGGDPKGTAAPLTLSEVAVTSLESMLDEDRQAPGAKKFEYDQLARKVFHNADAVLTVEDLSLIKERIGKGYGPAVVGAAWRILDPNASH